MKRAASPPARYAYRVTRLTALTGTMRPTLTQRISSEPAALGTLVASVLPAFVALGVLHMPAATIGVLVVAVNALAGFGIRMLLAPLPGTESATKGTAPVPAE